MPIQIDPSAPSARTGYHRLSIETALGAKVSETSGAAIQAIETIVGAGPEATTMIEKQRQDVVVAQGRGIRRIVSVCLKSSGPAIESVQPSSPRAEPKVSRAVLDHATNDARGNACEIRRIVPVECVLPGLSVESVQLAVVPIQRMPWPSSNTERRVPSSRLLVRVLPDTQ